jgi:hypothetical protein
MFFVHPVDDFGSTACYSLGTVAICLNICGSRLFPPVGQNRQLDEKKLNGRHTLEITTIVLL